MNKFSLDKINVRIIATAKIFWMSIMDIRSFSMGLMSNSVKAILPFRLPSCRHVLSVLLLSAISTATWAIDYPPETNARIDLPLNDENSIKLDFGDGQIMRVPKVVYGGGRMPDDSKGPVKTDGFGVTFRYPGMTLTGIKSAMTLIFEKQHGDYIPQPDSFPVNVNSMFYSKDELGNLPPGETPYRDPRPPRIELNNCPKVVADVCVDLKNISSNYLGINIVYFEDFALEHPEYKPNISGQGGDYVAKPESSYEISMVCPPPTNGLWCEAFVFDKATHFQYRMTFPAEAVSHTDALIKRFDDLLAQWIVR